MNELLIMGNVILILISIVFIGFYVVQKKKLDESQKKYSDLLNVISKDAIELLGLKERLNKNIEQIQSVTNKYKDYVSDQANASNIINMNANEISNRLSIASVQSEKIAKSLNDQKDSLIILQKKIKKQLEDFQKLTMMNNEMTVDWLRQENRIKEIQSAVEDIDVILKDLEGDISEANSLVMNLPDIVDEEFNFSDYIQTINQLMDKVEYIKKVHQLANDSVEFIKEVVENNHNDIAESREKIEQIRDKSEQMLKQEKVHKDNVDEFVQNQEKTEQMLKEIQEQLNSDHLVNEFIIHVSSEHQNLTSVKNEVEKLHNELNSSKDEEESISSEMDNKINSIVSKSKDV